jgi:hypothetical protein
VPQHPRLARITAIVGADPTTSGSYMLDVPALNSQSPWTDAEWADLLVQLTTAPDSSCAAGSSTAQAVATIDPPAPPGWLS